MRKSTKTFNNSFSNADEKKSSDECPHQIFERFFPVTC